MAKLSWEKRSLLVAGVSLLNTLLTGDEQDDCSFIRHIYKQVGIKYYNEVIKGRKYPIIKTVYLCKSHKKIKIKYVNAPYAFPNNVEVI